MPISPALGIVRQEGGTIHIISISGLRNAGHPADNITAVDVALMPDDRRRPDWRAGRALRTIEMAMPCS